MKKKLLVIAVAGALAAPPLVALAQSSVTISGKFHASIQNMRYAGTSKNPPSQIGVNDETSRLIFSVVEDLGQGLKAEGEFHFRARLDESSLAASGNQWIGLNSAELGRFRIGRLDLHYHRSESDISVRGPGDIDHLSLLSVVSNSSQAAGGVAIAGLTRTSNVVHYVSPKWSGWDVTLGWSANPLAVEADINSAVRKGRAWNVNPHFSRGPWSLGYTYWNQKADANAAADQKSDRFYGSYVVGGLKVGLVYDKSKLMAAAGGALQANRTAWSVPATYTFGPHAIHGFYTRADDDKAVAGADGATMFALGYSYDLSKRTSVAVTTGRIRNDANASYVLAGAASRLGAAGIAAGEDPRTWAFTIRHTF